MSDVNVFTVTGFIPSDPTYQLAGANETPLLKFSLGSGRPVKSKEGEWENQFFNVAAWREMASMWSDKLKKGSRVCVTGKLDQRKYAAADGTGTRLSIEIINPVISWAPSNNAGGTANGNANGNGAQQPAAPQPGASAAAPGMPMNAAAMPTAAPPVLPRTPIAGSPAPVVAAAAQAPAQPAMAMPTVPAAVAAAVGDGADFDPFAMA